MSSTKLSWSGQGPGGAPPLARVQVLEMALALRRGRPLGLGLVLGLGREL
jgi:hypothetical protein